MLEHEAPADAPTETLRASSLLHRTWIDHTFEIEAEPAQVLAAMTALDEWPRWVPSMSAVWRTKGPVGVGSHFALVLAFPWLRRVVLPCTVTNWSNELLEWGGGFPGSIVRHSFAIVPLAPGRTRVRHLEYATGLLAMLFRPFERFAYRFDSGWSQALSARLTR